MLMAMPAIKVDVKGAVVIRTSGAEFQVSAKSYTTAYLLKGGERLTLDQPVTRAGPGFSRPYGT